ncbi:MAG: 4-hydroxy-tetrahydrodipicolinate reductase [Phycisphaeraceae bacterium]
MISLGINGAAGRMGQRLIALAADDPDLRLVAALEREEHPSLGRDVGPLAGAPALHLPIATTWPTPPQVVIDFTHPDALRQLLGRARDAGVALVIGTTGLGDDDHAQLDAAADDIPVLQAPNMSLGVNLLFSLASQVARQLGDDYDIEILEAHHRHKLDAPSGTALGLAEAICQSTGKRIDQDVVHGRQGHQPRKPGEIGMHAMRLGDEVGRHTVCFAAPGEQIELAHRATTRDVFARGALRAAKWLADRPPGRYAMADVLGLGASNSHG